MWVGRKWRPICEDRAPYVQAVGVGKVVCRWVAGQGRAGQGRAGSRHTVARTCCWGRHSPACFGLLRATPPRNPSAQHALIAGLVGGTPPRHGSALYTCIHVYTYVQVQTALVPAVPPCRQLGLRGGAERYGMYANSSMPAVATVACTGKEKALLACSLNQPTSADSERGLCKTHLAVACAGESPQTVNNAPQQPLRRRRFICDPAQLGVRAHCRRRCRQHCRCTPGKRLHSL